MEEGWLMQLGGKWLIARDVILIQQGVPALYLLVLVLQTLVPVLQSLSFGSDTQLTPTYQKGTKMKGVLLCVCRAGGGFH